MLKDFSLSSKLYLGFASVLAIAAILGGFAYARLLEIDKISNSIVRENIPGIYFTGKLEGGVRRNMTLATRHVLCTDAGEMKKVDKDILENRNALNGFFAEYEKTIFTQEDKNTYEAIKPLRQAFVSVFDEQLLPLSRAGKNQEAKALLDGEFNTAYENYRNAVLHLQEMNKIAGEKGGVLIHGAVKSAKAGILAGLAIALAMGAAIGIFLSRSISSALNRVIQSLSEGSEQVSSASTQVSQSSQQMAEGASEQASSLEETSASLEELSSMTKQNSDNARQANSMAGDTRQAVEKSRSAMTRMSEAIGQIKNSSDQTAKIVKTIDEIAFQTNLLALNAAVEAARAGDAGKGFAVVAEEVRNLAQRSAEAAKNTSSLIEQSQKNADNGVVVSQEVAAILTQIVESVNKLGQLIGEVSSASQEQSKGIGQIGMAVTEMDKLTQSNAANAEESASASEELSAQANELKDMVKVLVGIVSGSSGTADRPAPRFAEPASRVGTSRPGIRENGFKPAHPASSKDRANTAAKSAAATGMKHDWSGVPAGTKPRKTQAGNGHAAVSARTAHPEAVIPLNDDELKDF